jgi:hypothetical protein
MNLDKPLLFSSVAFTRYHDDFWNSIHAEAGEGGKFTIDIATKLTTNRFVPRHGEWSLPWEQTLIPGYEMPAYDPAFSKTFEQVSDERALEIKARVNAGEKFAVMYSGGIDSTVVMSALIRNLTTEELKSIIVCASADTVIENPVFWSTQIAGKFTVRNSQITKYDTLIEEGLTPITADEGDCMFGTVLGLNLYANYEYYIQDLSPETQANLRPLKYKIADGDIHFSAYKDLIIKHMGVPNNPNFGRMFYEKMVKNINTSKVPVHSLHDFFWWEIFNVKYLNCAVRGALYFNDRVEWQKAVTSIFNWFCAIDYQRWSMANNNNGIKIQNTLSTYKQCAKDYIWTVDKNDWYRYFKIKLDSLGHITFTQDVSVVDQGRRPVDRTGLTGDWEMMYLDDPVVRDFFRERLLNYKVDWE